MADSDEENDQNFSSDINMTGFLFGNIDDNGELEDDILDQEAKQHLASLGRFGFNSFIREMMSNNVNEQSDKEGNQTLNNEKDEDYTTKSPTALDFSDINELADDLNEDNLGNYIISLHIIDSHLISSCPVLYHNYPLNARFYDSWIV